MTRDPRQIFKQTKADCENTSNSSPEYCIIVPSTDMSTIDSCNYKSVLLVQIIGTKYGNLWY